MKQLIIIVCIVFAVNALKAQNNSYDLAVATYIFDTPKPHITVSINGERFVFLDVEKGDMDGEAWGRSLNPLIKQVNKLQAEGWEVVGGVSNGSLSVNAPVFFYNLRKKK